MAENKPSFSQQYVKWKTAVPLLYDWFANHNLTWPSLSCRWGAPIEETQYKRRQYIYISERTDASEPNKLMLVPVEICKPRVAAAEAISGFHEKAKSRFVQRPMKTILHPGEVNKIRELPEDPNIVATHSDAKEVYLWHFKWQTDRGLKKDDWAKLSQPDVLLTGHTDIAEFALATSSANPLVASGGRDTYVLLWNLKDFDGGSLLTGPRSAHPKSSRLACSTTLKGHTNTIGDLTFRPESSVELGSVGDDRKLLLWDTRTGCSPCASVPQAHSKAELRCMDWSAKAADYIATGAEDGSLKVWDRRKFSSAVNTFDQHSSSLIRVEWSNYKPGVLASGGEDGVICIWDLTKKAQGTAASDHTQEVAKLRAAIPAELIFQHAGHQAGQIADFQWHPTDHYTMVSVSDDPEGGTLQLWRVNDLIYRPEAEVLAELEQYRDEILPREKSGWRAEAVAKEAGIATPELSPKPEVVAPLSAGGGSAPAATPAEAFVGVPEGVAVAAAERPAEAMT